VDKVLILDFGSQFTQLIARRIRDVGIYTEILPGDAPFPPDGKALDGVRGIILSGSPHSAYEEGAPVPDRAWYDCGLPLLGICYGLQRITMDFGGKVGVLSSREYGKMNVRLDRASKNLAGPARRGFEALFDGVPDSIVGWMSHGDSIEKPAPGFQVVASSDNGIPAAFVHESKPIFGLQFHPEVTHTEHGFRILENFAAGICGAKREWTMTRFLEEAKATLVARAADRDVLLLISGGVDSTVVAALLLSCLDPERVHLMYVDTGLMREGETDEVRITLDALGARHLHVIDAKARFLSALAGLSDPEAKRRAIGDLFITVQKDETVRIWDSPDREAEAFLAQGTLYTDLIESGKGVGKKAQTIKSHHNVRSPLVEKKRAEGKIIEPLDRLYKDEVRALGRLLGVPDRVLSRHPFPGPGLAVRMPGEVTEEKLAVLRRADTIFLAELKSRGLYDRIWQAFCVLLPVRAVGVAGDARKYGWVCALRAITSADGMTADVFPFEMKDLLEISALITNRVPEVGRVVYDVSSKPPATIEWE
jgi:GMP synthase (glutamine-hydrolysing)